VIRRLCGIRWAWASRCQPLGCSSRRRPLNDSIQAYADLRCHGRRVKAAMLREARRCRRNRPARLSASRRVATRYEFAPFLGMSERGHPCLEGFRRRTSHHGSIYNIVRLSLLDPHDRGTSFAKPLEKDAHCGHVCELEHAAGPARAILRAVADEVGARESG